MGLVKFGDLVNEVKINIDRNKNPYEYYVAGDHMDSEDLTIRRRGSFATDDVGPAFTRLFKPGQILYGSRRTYLKKVAVADFEGICSNTTFVLETKDESILRQRLLPFIMLTDDFTKWSISKSKGSTNPYILFSDLANYEFDLPDIGRQDELVKLLWQAYETKESYKEMIRATDEMVKSQFIARFGTTERSTYPVRTLKEIAVSSGEYGANTPATKFNPAIGRYIRITDIDDSGNLNSDMVSPEVAEDKYLLQEGDLLFARTGATVGKTYLHKKGKAFYAGYLIKYRFLDAVLPDFVFAYTHSQEYYKWVELTQKVGAQPNISAKQYDGLRIIVPPLEEQKLFIVLMNQADKSKYLN